mgnify:CR=1 FL=1
MQGMSRMTDARAVPIIIDCDPGVDDAIAILMALGNKEAIDLRAITCVAGNVPLTSTSANARRVLELAGHPEISVYNGCASPIMKCEGRRSSAHGNDGLGGVILPDPVIEVHNEHAIDAINRIARETAGGIVLCPIGPMTNIALALLRYPDLAARAFVISSFGKTYHVTGWKIAYCVAPKAMSAEFRKVHQYVSFCTVSPMQYALAEFLQSSPHHLELASFYQAKRDRFRKGLMDSRFKLLPCAGTYFQMVDYSEISDMPDVELAHKLTIDEGIASIPVSVFYQKPPKQNVLRFCFAKSDETLDQATELLRGI